jgi:hypothetical protein
MYPFCWLLIGVDLKICISILDREIPTVYLNPIAFKSGIRVRVKYEAF